MTSHKVGTSPCPLAWLPHLDAQENLARMATECEALSRVKALSRLQRRLKDLYGNLLLLLSNTDWTHPYAVDLGRIYTQCLEHGRYTEDVPPAQEQALAIIPYLVISSETLRVHEKAVASRDWAHVDYTLRQLAEYT